MWNNVGKIKGDKGEQGERGLVGPQGAKGDTGAQGIQGATGLKGDIGPKGDTGPKGEPGIQGATGAKGATGATGAQGLQGAKGDKGDAGFVPKNVVTTAGRYWSTNANKLETSLNSETRNLISAPSTDKRTLVIFGSSTAEGFYGTDGNSWWEKLKAQLEPLGWEVIQRAWSGDSTTRGLDRMHKDVIPYNPDVAIIAFTLGNEGMLGGTSTDNKEVYKSNMKERIMQMVTICRRNNIVPIVADQFPTKRYTRGFYETAENLNKEIDSMGIPIINQKGSIDALTADGQPLDLAMHDELHPNDRGHHAMFMGINPDFINLLGGIPSYNKPQKLVGGGIKFPATAITDSVIPLSYIPRRAIESFTITFTMQATAVVAAQRTWASFNSTDLRVSNQGTGTHAVDLRGGGMSAALISSVGLDDLEPHSIAISFSNISKFVKFYVDGKLVGTNSSPDLVFDEFTIGGKRSGAVIATNMIFRDLAVYRARLSDQQIRDIHNGYYYSGGLDLFSHLNEMPMAQGRFSNLALTRESIKIWSDQLSNA